MTALYIRSGVTSGGLFVALSVGRRLSHIELSFLRTLPWIANLGQFVTATFLKSLPALVFRRFPGVLFRFGRLSACIYAASILFLGSTAPIFAQSTWLGTVDTEFDEGLNWDTSPISPGAGDTAIINVRLPPHSPVVNSSITVDSLTIETSSLSVNNELFVASEFLLSGDGTVTVNTVGRISADTIRITGGTLFNNGILNGGMNLFGGTTTSTGTVASVSVKSGGVFRAQGTVAGTMLTEVGGLAELTGDLMGSGALTNNGKLSANRSAVVTFAAGVTNGATGTIDLADGKAGDSLVIAGALQTSGVIKLDVSAHAKALVVDALAVSGSLSGTVNIDFSNIDMDALRVPGDIVIISSTDNSSSALGTIQGLPTDASMTYSVLDSGQNYILRATRAPQATTATLTGSSPSSTRGEPVTLVATVSGLGKPAPVGTVAFRDGLTQIGSAALSSPGRDFVQVAVGEYHSCARTSAGQVFCWGDGSSGKLGDGTNASRSAPVLVQGLLNATDLSLDLDHTCAVLSSGSVTCWGGNLFGQLGDGTTTDSTVPVLVTGITNATDVTAGQGFSCARLTSGSVRCWGKNSEGQLGDGTTTDRLTPVPVVGINSATSVSAGMAHTCARLAAGALKCWGDNAYGQLGNGSMASSLIPVAVSGITTATMASAGARHNCARVTTGAVWCWGWGFQGQLGDGATVDRSTPVAVIGVSTATSVSSGSLHSCAALSTGGARCWGSGYDGQLGSGTTDSSETPVTVAGLTAAVSVSSGGAHSCSSLVDGSVQCWGSNSYGQLGSGTTVGQTSPVSVENSGGSIASAELVVDTLPVGTRSLQAVYSGSLSAEPSSSAIVNHVVARAGQTITFASISSQTFEQGKVLAVTASASSGLSVSFESETASRCSVSGANVTLLSAGTCKLRAVQTGNADYEAAAPVTRSFTILRASQFITFDVIANQIFSQGRNAPLVGISSSGLLLSFASQTTSTCTTSGTTVTLVGAGTCTVRASQSGNANYTSAAPVTRSFSIARGSQVISAVPIEDQVFAPNRTIALIATANSQLPVTFSALAPHVCALDGTMAKPRGPGLCRMAARQAGDARYVAATDVEIAFKITTALGPEVQPTVETRFDQNAGEVATLGNGAVIAYAGRRADTGPFAIVVQRVTAAGAPVGRPIEVAPPQAGTGSAHVATLAQGFVVVWQGADPSGSGIFAQRFSQSAARVGPVVAVNAFTTGNQSMPRVVGLPEGGFVVVWETSSQTSGSDIVMRRFSASGVATTAEISVNTTRAGNQTRPRIAALADGTVSVVWSSETATKRFGVRARIYRPSGVALTPERVVDDLGQLLSPRPAVAARTGTGAQGGFVVAYEASRDLSRATPADIMVKRISAAGSIQTGRSQANDTKAGHRFDPEVAPLKNGAFAAIFTSPDGAGNGIGLRIFGVDGAALGEEEQGNAAFAGSQAVPALAAVGSSTSLGATYLAIWSSPGPSGQGINLIGRRFQGP